MRRSGWLTAAALVITALLVSCAAIAEPAEEMRLSVSKPALQPGDSVVVELLAPDGGTCNLYLEAPEGFPVIPVMEERSVQAGYNAMYWNGTSRGYPVPEGEWNLVAEMAGYRAETTILIGRTIPSLIRAELLNVEVTSRMSVRLSFCASESADMEIVIVGADGEKEVFLRPVEMGDGEVTFPASVCGGEAVVTARLVREDGVASDPVLMSMRIREPRVSFTPTTGSPKEGTDRTMNGWTVPMDIMDEAAVWEALTAPVTVVDDGRDRAQVRQLVVRKNPEEDSEGTGTVTMASQGVHVLEKGEEWSLIETYASSFHDSAVVNWNALIQGYVPTRYLKEIVPNQQMGMVVDKLTQRMYIFRDGKLFTSLVVSTGLANEKQPYNETRAGEFLLISRVGGFYSDNMYCPLAIRFNDGDLLHEVPYISSSNGRDYSSTEPKLGTRASHGCIRVQRKKNPEGINQQWIWNHYRKNTKILIWEDWQGRQIPVPEDEKVFWYNPRKNDYYHGSDHCEGMGTRNPKEITYGELCGEAGSRLRACPYCGPEPKKDRLEEMNALYAEGGDHDPVMTEARKSCPRKPKER